MASNRTMVRGISFILLVLAATASAQPKVNLPPLVNATEVVKLAPQVGFVDDPIAHDDTRIAYVVADAALKSELHVVTLADKHEDVIDISAVTVHAIGLELVGSRAFVVGLADEGKQVGALVELAAKDKKPAGTVVYKIGPATHITVIQRDGKPRIAVHRATATKEGTRHEAELLAIDTGKRIAAGPPLELDATGASKTLELRVNHWADGMTRALGVKGGEWDRKENQRTTDTEATYDLVTGKVLDRKPITDLFEQRKRFQVLADAGGKLDFFHVTWDNSALEIWHDGKAKTVALDQQFSNYDPKSVQGVIAADGSAWLALKVDPVNPDAVGRKRADPEYLDIFRASVDGKATRVARILATGLHHRFGLVGAERFWLLERSASFDRGGRNLAVFQLAANAGG
jgi:hypothetical protein